VTTIADSTSLKQFSGFQPVRSMAAAIDACPGHA
jgi:hypothetical protein